jgi:hypothetical protein
LNRDQRDQHHREREATGLGTRAPDSQTTDGLQESQIEKRQDRGGVVVLKSHDWKQPEQTAREQKNTEAFFVSLEWIRPDQGRNKQGIKAEEKAIHAGKLDQLRGEEVGAHLLRLVDVDFRPKCSHDGVVDARVEIKHERSHRDQNGCRGDTQPHRREPTLP